MGETLDLALALEGRTKAAPENAQLVVIAEALSNLPDPQIDTSFMLALEQRLLTEEIAGQQPARTLTVVPSTAPAPVREVRRAPVVQMPKRRFVVRRSLVAVAAAASLAAFPVVAAAQSLPGSPFHSIKLKVEHALIAVFGTPTEDMVSHMTLADRRMGEVEKLIATDGAANDIALGLYLVKSELNKASALIAQTDDPAVLRMMADQAHATEMRLRQAASEISQSAGDEFAGALGPRSRSRTTSRTSWGSGSSSPPAAGRGADRELARFARRRRVRLEHGPGARPEQQGQRGPFEAEQRRRRQHRGSEADRADRARVLHPRQRRGLRRPAGPGRADEVQHLTV